MRKALIITVDGDMRTTDLDGSEGEYNILSGAVGGYIERVSMRGFDLYLNEEGKVNGLPLNPGATSLFQIEFGPVDVIVGDVILTGPVNSTGDNTGLPEGIESVLRHLVETGYQAY